MTTMTMDQQPSNGLGRIAGLVLILAVVFAALFFMASLPHEELAVQIIKLPEIEIPPEEHAAKHPEAALIRKCLQDKGGADSIFRTRDKKDYFALCQLPDGRWGFRGFRFQAIRKVWEEITAYVPDDTSRSGVIKFLEKTTTKFNGPYPW